MRECRGGHRLTRRLEPVRPGAVVFGSYVLEALAGLELILACPEGQGAGVRRNGHDRRGFGGRRA